MRIKKLKVVDYCRHEVTSRKLHPAGYLILPDCVIARSGILEYSNVQAEDGDLIANGQTISVYRPPEALKKCVNQFNHVPVTLEHPKENAVDPNMVKKVIVGVVGGNCRCEDRDGETYIIGDIIVHDADAIQELQKEGNYQELSAGYETAYKKKRGVTDSGVAYEAEQYFLEPNHVALVENGRCGSECRICDHDDNKQNMEKKHMSVKKTLSRKAKEVFRYFLATDGSDEVKELPADIGQAMEKDEDVEVEELDEDEVQFEDVDVPGIEKPEETDEDEEVEVPEDEENEEVDEDEETEVPEDEEEETADEEEIFEVDLGDGVVGKMDQAAYDFVKRYLDAQKKGDSMESTAKILKLNAEASRILGEGYAVDSYIDEKGFNETNLKLAIIKKVMPQIVTKSLKNQAAIDSLYDSAVKTSKSKKIDWQSDMATLMTPTPVVDSKNVKSVVEVARQKRLAIINSKKGE